MFDKPKETKKPATKVEPDTKDTFKALPPQRPLVNAKNFTFKMMITKINGRLIKKNERDSAIVKDGDDVQVIHMISGG